MSYFSDLVTYRALHFKLQSSGATPLHDQFIDQILDDPKSPANQQVQQVCAKLPICLARRLDDTCNILDVSKRRFIEAAIIAALDEADRIQEAVGMTDNLQPVQEAE